MQHHKKRLDTAAASAYLTNERGLPTSGKTLKNWRAQGKGPRLDYYGNKPLYTVEALDEWADEALTTESPARRNIRLRGEAERLLALLQETESVDDEIALAALRDVQLLMRDVGMDWRTLLLALVPDEPPRRRGRPPREGGTAASPN